MKARTIAARKKMISGANLLVCSVTCCLCASVVWWWRRHAAKTARKRRCLAIVTRYPTPGTTKTRLIPAVGERGAALLQLYMAEKMIDLGQAASQRSKDIDTEVIYNGGTESEVSYWLERKRQRAGLSWRPQSEGGLGQKLTNLFSCLFSEGALYVVAVGTDIPGITGELIEESFTLLESGNCLVLGEAEDGGYYLIGISSGEAKNLGALFQDIDWGTERVLSQQMERAADLGIATSVLSTTLSDVDTVEDLAVFERAFGLTRSQLLEPRLSVVVPVYNEKDSIVKTLNNIIQSAAHRDRLEVIISDGGSKDGTQQAVTEFAASSGVPVTLINSPPGRGPQLRYGTTFAKGDNFLFMHADSVLPHEYDSELQLCLERPGTVAGAFKFDLDIFHPNLWTGKLTTLFKLKMKIITKSTHRRASKLELPYGDQGLFMTRETYKRVGGYQDVYLMEDFIMVKELQKVGHISISNSCMITSARRWREHGALKVTFLNNFLVSCYCLGVKPNTLARWYYGEKLKKILDQKEN